MTVNLPLGYWLLEKTETHYRIGFEHGGHAGGDCEITIPKDKLEKFCTDEGWRKLALGKFGKIIRIGGPVNYTPPPPEHLEKDGIVPDDWDGE